MRSPVVDASVIAFSNCYKRVTTMQVSMNTGTSRKRVRFASLVAVAALFSACADPIAAPSASPTFARFPGSGGVAENNQSCIKNGINGKSPNEKNQCGEPTIPAVASIANSTGGNLYYTTFSDDRVYFTCSTTLPYPSGNILSGAVQELTPCDQTAAGGSVTIYLVSVFADASTESYTLLGPISVTAPGATCVETDAFQVIDDQLNGTNGLAWACTIPVVSGSPASTVPITVTSATAP